MPYWPSSDMSEQPSSGHYKPACELNPVRKRKYVDTILFMSEYDVKLWLGNVASATALPLCDIVIIWVVKMAAGYVPGACAPQRRRTKQGDDDKEALFFFTFASILPVLKLREHLYNAFILQLLTYCPLALLQTTHTSTLTLQCTQNKDQLPLDTQY